MSRAWWMMFAAALLGVWNAGIVWFTQIAVYPLWPLVGAEQFHGYHLAWWHDMWPSVLAVGMFARYARVREEGIAI